MGSYAHLSLQFQDGHPVPNKKGPLMFPPSSWQDVEDYDHAEVVAGYLSYRRDDPKPGPNHSDGFRWGWQNGFADHNYRDLENGDDGFRSIRFAYIAARRERGLAVA